MIFVFDIDGTLANNQHRVHWLYPEEQRNWDAYFAAAPDDGYIYPICETLFLAARGQHCVVLLTGRGEEHREQTVEWLAKGELPYDALLMRPEGNRDDDDILKVRMLTEWLNESYWLPDDKGPNDIIIFEDRKRVVEAFRSLGFLVAHVAEGDF